MVGAIANGKNWWCWGGNDGEGKCRRETHYMWRCNMRSDRSEEWVENILCLYVEHCQILLSASGLPRRVCWWIVVELSNLTLVLCVEDHHEPIKRKVEIVGIRVHSVRSLWQSSFHYRLITELHRWEDLPFGGKTINIRHFESSIHSRMYKVCTFKVCSKACRPAIPRSPLLEWQ